MVEPPHYLPFSSFSNWRTFFFLKLTFSPSPRIKQGDAHYIIFIPNLREMVQIIDLGGDVPIFSGDPAPFTFCYS